MWIWWLEVIDVPEYEWQKSSSLKPINANEYKKKRAIKCCATHKERDKVKKVTRTSYRLSKRQNFTWSFQISSLSLF